MQFKHPEILYFLVLLIIPILVHLFQLRRFKKVAFTNVKFLKEVELQTRKSSNLKKFLVLLSRLLLFTALVFIFAQPYFGKNTKVKKSENIYIYLDNSLSMQAKGKNGVLLKRAIQDIIKNTASLNNVHLFTNDNYYKNLSRKDLKNTLLSIQYHPIQTDVKSILLKIQNKIQTQTQNSSSNTILLISDFQNINLDDAIKLDSINNYYIAKLTPINTNNISIDSVSIGNQSSTSTTINAFVKNYSASKENIAISLFNKTVLSGKSNSTIAGSTTQQVVFKIPNTSSFNGKLQIDDGYLDFDNTLYFSVHKPEKINVTAIGKKNAFLSKIYSENEFNFRSTTANKFDYNSINNQHLIVFNELENIPIALINSSKYFLNNGGSLVIIPPINTSLDSYNTFLKEIGLGKIIKNEEVELAITNIRFSHPLLKGVFEKKIKNFQYPTVNSYYTSKLQNSSSILNFENGKPYISQVPIRKGKVYWFSASLDTKNSNFKNSPLIVPIFYNFGIYSFQVSEIYYTIGKINTIEINTQLNKDEVLHLGTKGKDFIPEQQITAKKVILTTELNPIESGFTTVSNNNKSILNLAFNYDRKESDLSSIDLKNYFEEATNIYFPTTINELFTAIADQHNTSSLWKIFTLLALLFLGIEIVLLKFLKS